MNKQRINKKKRLHPAIFLLKKIPKGRVATYKEMARVCGTSPRAIGRIMADNPYPDVYPCYKVVSSRGELCGYSGQGGLKGKERLLKGEGILFQNGKIDPKYFYTFFT
ncbi:MAG: MGMT family protein [Candidatus Wildermuthbacteria bacterium]|nr:MGMT family protein [Candidatus Wildermuthbacteria bacterium]